MTPHVCYSDVMRRAVIDTNVLLEGLTHLSPEAEVVDAWADRRFQPCVSTAWALEYQDVLTRKLGVRRQNQALKALQALLVRCDSVPVRFSYRPSSQDPGDDMVVDCVLNCGALQVTNNVKDFRVPSREYGFRVLRPEEFLNFLEQKGQS